MKKYIVLASILFLVAKFEILSAQCRITHLSGTQNYNGINVTVSHVGSVDTMIYCYGKLGPYWVGVHYSPPPFTCKTGSYSFSFSPPVSELYLNFGGVNSEVGGNSEIVRIFVNGSHYPLTTVGDTLPCQQLAILTPEGDIASPTWNVAGWEGTKLTGTIHTLMVQDSILSGCANGSGFSLSFCPYPLSAGEVEMKAGEIEVYPNPNNGKFQIKCKNSKSQKMLFNTIGEMILSTKENEIDVSHLPKGVYFLKSEGQVRKVMVE